MNMPKPLPSKPEREAGFFLGPKTRAWIEERIKPAHDGSEKVAASDRMAKRAREMAQEGAA